MKNAQVCCNLKEEYLEEETLLPHYWSVQVPQPRPSLFLQAHFGHWGAQGGLWHKEDSQHLATYEHTLEIQLSRSSQKSSVPVLLLLCADNLLTVSLQLPLSILEEVEEKGELFVPPSRALEAALCPCTALASPSASPSPGLLLVATIRG